MRTYITTVTLGSSDAGNPGCDRSAARRAIRGIEGKDIEDVSEYLDPLSPKYERMVEWIRRELGATTLKYQAIEDMIQAIGLDREKLRAELIALYYQYRADAEQAAAVVAGVAAGCRARGGSSRRPRRA